MADHAAKQDDLVTSAMSHWGPRFVSNGVALTDFEEITGRLQSWDDWCSAWSERAADHERMGRLALAEGHAISAGEHLERAGVYYHFAKFLFVHDLAQMKAAHMKAVACRSDALPYLRPAGERIAIPYEGKTLFGILRKPAGIARPPVVVMVMGLDSAKEETAAYEQPFLARGIATLAFDGPGQGEGEYDLAIRGDYEQPVKAVFDWLASRGDLDTSRAALWGVSMGGYYAARAAAFETRAKACIALAGPYDLADCWDSMPQLTRTTFRVRAKCETEAEAKRHAATLSLKGLAQQIACPLYIVSGKLDRVIPWQHAERLAREASGEVVFNLIEDGNHIANNRPYRWRSQSADWLADKLGAKPASN
jgi:2,6-dihydroxypseudooxynicotine hydrolase